MYQISVPHTAEDIPNQLGVRRDGATFYGIKNGAWSGYHNVGTTSSTLVSYSINDISHTSSGAGWNGTYYIVRMYNRALSTAELLQNYNANKARFGL